MNQQGITLTVVVNRVAYPPPTVPAEANTWYILITDYGACKGRMSWRPKDNDQLVLEGEWAVYKGEREFAFKSARIDVPLDARDQLHYVCMRTPGLGPAAEQLIWEKAGAAWMEIAEGAVPRLNGKTFANFRLQLEDLRGKTEESKVVATLIGKGATMNMAVAAWERWGKETLGVVNSDPYRLSDLAGYGFKDVDDKIRRAYGIEDDDKRRIRAAVLYSLRRLTDSGDTLVTWERLYQSAVSLLGGHSNLVTDATRDLFAEGALIGFPESEGVSLAADWQAEKAIWDFAEKGTTNESQDCSEAVCRTRPK